jgi:crescentin
MNIRSSFFARKGGLSAVEEAESPSPEAKTNGDAQTASYAWTEIGRRVGADNEVLRNLLVDIGHRIEALDVLKDTFGELVGPIDQALRALEQEKFDNVQLRGALSELRAKQEALQSQTKELTRKFASSEGESERLRQELGHSQHALAALEAVNSGLANELEVARARLSELDSELVRESAAVRLLSDHKEKLTEHAATVGKRLAELDAEVGSLREMVVLRENENRTLQTSLDQIAGENARYSRRLTEQEMSLEKARLHYEQLKTGMAGAETERSRLIAAADEANERRRSETNALSTRLEAVSSRAAAAEKLLAEARQNLQTRAEENGAAERKAVEAAVARDATDKKLESVQKLLQMKERQVQDLEQGRAKLTERVRILERTEKAREADAVRAEEKARLLAERVAHLEAEAEANRLKGEESIAELNSMLQSEHRERIVSEGALFKVRASYTELQRQVDEYAGGQNGRLRIPRRPTPKDLPQPEG